MTLKEEIKKAAEEFVFTVNSVEIATLMEGVVAVWINERRFGSYDIHKHKFIMLMA